jgi:2,3-bisphosphoglycerate-independent phosphoglycerate mutase
MVQDFVEPDFNQYDRGRLPRLSGLATMTRYEAAFTVPVAFEKEDILQSMGEIVSSLGLAQLRIAETEKYAHVTYFFNCGREEPFPNESRKLIPSPRDVATYDLKPAMSAEQVTAEFIKEWATGRYTFAVCNLANPDMVGHTGVIKAAVKAIETVDACVGKIAKAVLPQARMIITSDHGNAEKMLDDDGKPHTAHTTNPVFFHLLDYSPAKPASLRSDGRLGDIAPTILRLWGIEPPAAMTGQSLLP